jgi:hypothetical protein
MSASSERILLQIIELESKIQEDRVLGKDTTVLEEQVAFLKKDLSSLNEVLTSPNFVLKG